MGFYRETLIKAVRKARQCCACSRVIDSGMPALNCAGSGPDGFWAADYHTECRAAEIGFNDLKDYRWGDEWYPLHEMEFDDWQWLLAEYPIVAERMNITSERYQEAVSRYARDFGLPPPPQGDER